MDDSPALRATTPADLVELIPYLLGFHPRESLILVCLRQGRVACTARADLAGCSDVEDVAELIRRLSATTRMERLIGLSYAGDRNSAVASLDLVETVSPVEVADLLVVGPTGWESLCSGLSGAAPGPGVVSAAAVYAGMGAAAGREDVAGLVECRASVGRESVDLDRIRLRIAWWNERRRRARVQELLRRPDDEPLADDELAELAFLITDPDTRDAALLEVTRGSADRLLTRWLQVAQAIPDIPVAVHAVAMAGMCAWVAGEGALHVAALERGQRLGAESGLLNVLADIHQLALPPHYWDELRRSMAA